MIEPAYVFMPLDALLMAFPSQTVCEVETAEALAYEAVCQCMITQHMLITKHVL